MSDNIPQQLEELKKAQAAVDVIHHESKKTIDTAVQQWSPDLVEFLSVSLLMFFLASLLICAILLWRSRANGFHVLRVFGIITIIGMSSVLMVAGYDDDQLTPIVGLFGAIAGYLLGKERDSSSASRENS